MKLLRHVLVLMHHLQGVYEFTLANTTCKLPEDGVLTPKHARVIYYKFTVLISAYDSIY